MTPDDTPGRKGLLGLQGVRWWLVALVLAATAAGAALVAATLLEATMLSPDREALAFAVGLELLIVGFVTGGLMAWARRARRRAVARHRGG